MGRFEWVGKAKRIEPDGLYEIVVRKPGVKAATKAAADETGARASSILAGHRHDGHARIEVTQGTVVDAFVNLVDPAAMSIEFGHMHAGWERDDGDPIYVQGVAPLRRAIGRG